MDLDELKAAIQRVREGANEAFGHGREDFREALKRGYAKKDERQTVAASTRCSDRTEQSPCCVRVEGSTA